MNLSFFVPGQAVPKQSFRKTKTGGFIPKRVTDWQDTVSWKAREAMQRAAVDLADGEPLRVEIEFYLKDCRIVDLDNLSKSVLDGMKGIVFSDDRWVHRLVLTKVEGYKENPHVWVNVSKYTGYQQGDEQ